MKTVKRSEIPQLILDKDPYLVDYLVSWGGYAPDMPWGAATSFALEVAKYYGLIISESDSTLTDKGKYVVAELVKLREQSL